MLGFLHNAAGARFVPTSSFRPPNENHRSWRAIDARHGRVLLHSIVSVGSKWEDLFAVWDPITADWSVLPTLGMTQQQQQERRSWSAAVLCAAGDACSHLDCHDGPFQVVIVSSYCLVTLSSVYSSEAGKWLSEVTIGSSNTRGAMLSNHGIYFVPEKPNSLVENALYFMCRSGTDTNLLKYNLVENTLSLICLPPAFYDRDIVLTTMEDGRLGFAILEDSKLCLWSRDAGSDGRAWWTRSRVVELKKLLPVDAMPISLDVVAFVDRFGVCFVRMGDGLFVVDLKSSNVKKFCNVSGRSTIFPYMSFCTPGTDFLCHVLQPIITGVLIVVKWNITTSYVIPTYISSIV